MGNKDGSGSNNFYNDESNHGAQGNFYGNVSVGGEIERDLLKKRVFRTKIRPLILGEKSSHLFRLQIFLFCLTVLVICLWFWSVNDEILYSYTVVRVSYFGFSLPFVLIIVVWPVFLTFGLSLILKRKKYLRIVGLNIELGSNMIVYRSRIDGICPYCDSVLKVREVFYKEEREVKLICQTNSKHRWDFDHTLLVDVARDPLNAKQKR